MHLQVKYFVAIRQEYVFWKMKFRQNLCKRLLLKIICQKQPLYVKKGERYKLRWFTPGFEIDLCGHATLATAYVITTFVEPEITQIEFETMSGVLKVGKKGKGI